MQIQSVKQMHSEIWLTEIWLSFIFAIMSLSKGWYSETPLYCKKADIFQIQNQNAIAYST